MGARWYWAAVCPNLHVYSNFSGGADPCYECNQDPEVEFDGSGDNAAPDALAQAHGYANQRKGGQTPEQIQTAGEVKLMKELAAKHGFTVASI